MARRGGRDRGKEWYWRRVLRRWRRSGQGVRSYCREHGLSEPLFYAWRRTIQERDRQAASKSQRGRRQAGSPGGSTAADHCQGDGLPHFVPVTIAAPLASPPSLEVLLSHGRVIRVPTGFDAVTLRQLLAVLAEAPSC